MRRGNGLLKMNARSFLKVVCTSGIVAGTVDIGSACVIFKCNPIVILQAVAAGLLGTAAFHMGFSAAALGLVLQWAMSIVIAGCCALTSHRFDGLARHWVAAGLAYGVVIYFVMNYIVVPLSAALKPGAITARLFIENMAAMLLFGLIITYRLKGLGHRLQS